MSVLSLATTTLRAYLLSKLPSLDNDKSYCGRGCFFTIVWLLVICGGLFGLSSLYEYYNAAYSSIIAKAYMSVTLLVTAGISSLVYLVGKWIYRLSHKSKVPQTVESIEKYTKNALKTIELEGGELVKQHPLAATLIGVLVGLLSGTLFSSKRG